MRLTPLVGRENELRDVVQAVTRCRLLTLTGPGGAGKTRLALAAARSALASFPAGVCWVELAQIDDPGIVGQAVATRLGVPETPGQDTTDAVAEYVGEHQVLVVLDNCEHLTGATARLAEDLLAACPALTVLATSREALGVEGELMNSWVRLGETARAVRHYEELVELLRQQVGVSTGRRDHGAVPAAGDRALTVRMGAPAAPGVSPGTGASAECLLSGWPGAGTTIRSEDFYNSAVADAEGGAFELGTDGPKVILVGVDGSVTSMRAGAYAAGLARRQGARLVCVYVERRGTLYGASAGAGAAVIAEQDRALDETAADLRQQFEEGSARLGLPLTFITTTGDPYHELRRVADEVRADAVVVGASAQAGHRWVGSLAVRLVKAGRWPVTVVP